MTNTEFYNRAAKALQKYKPYDDILSTYPQILSVLDTHKLNDENILDFISEIRIAHILNKLGYPLDDIKNIFSNKKINTNKIGGPDFYIRSQNTFIEVVSPKVKGEQFYQQKEGLIEEVRFSIVQLDSKNLQNIMAHITAKIREKNEQIKGFKEKINQAKYNGLLEILPENARYIIAISISGLDPRGGMLVHNDEYFPLFVNCLLPVSNFTTFQISEDNIKKSNRKDKTQIPKRILGKNFSFSSSRSIDINKFAVWIDANEIDAVIFFNPYVGSNLDYANTTTQIWGILSPLTTMTEKDLCNIFTSKNHENFKCNLITYETKFSVSLKQYNSN